METTGILYIATGQRFLREAEASAKSAKRIMPTVPIALASDLETESRDVDIRLRVEYPEHSFIDKIESLKYSPFQRTLFLDSDTFLLAPLGDLFTLLDRFDIAAAHEPARYLYSVSGIPDSFPELNSGAILYRNTREVHETFDAWLRLYRDENRRNREAGRPTWHDQASFTQAVWDSGLRFFALPPEWNYRAIFPQFVSGRVRVFHGRLKRLSSELDFVNRAHAPRLFCPNPRRLPGILVNTYRLFRLLYR